MTEPTEPQETPAQESARKAWIEPRIDVAPIDDTAVAPFTSDVEGGSGVS